MASGAEAILAYLDRALADDDLIDGLRELVTDTRRASRRTRRRGAGDRRAQRNVFRALGALTGVVREAREPTRPRRGRAFVLVAVGAGALTALRRARARPPTGM